VLSANGSEKFADLTTKNVGESIAIVWGDRVVSSANIKEPIVGGVGRISGDFTEQDAKYFNEAGHAVLQGKEGTGEFNRSTQRMPRV
jgi:preprotein translocase subunit SecD